MQNAVFQVLLLARKLDRTVHEPARLLILSMLSVVDSVDFVFLHNHSGLTRGNFSTHISKLEEEGYIQVKKEFVDRRPTTTYSISDTGRSALLQYRDQMQTILNQLS